MTQFNLGGWEDCLSNKTIQLAHDLYDRAMGERDSSLIYPPQDEIFRALQLTPYEKVSVVIVGQDPYINPSEACGLAFSVRPGIKIPPSLRNIFNELQNDIGCSRPLSGDLTAWAERGVLLLNTVLTVHAGESNSHADWGWQDFTLEVFRACTKLPQPIVFVLWGGQARAFTAGLQLSSLLQQKKACIWSTHPSPFSAYKGHDTVPAFLGSRPFSHANLLLERMGGVPIDWRLP